jgi:hypothetical protein
MIAGIVYLATLISAASGKKTLQQEGARIGWVK